jgi:hypothetical protein
MSEKPKTPCECPLAGFCERHGIQKSSHYHKLCQNHSGYFAQWEACRGPGQNPNDCKKNNDDKFIQQEEPAQEEPAQEMPSKIQMAKNFAKSAVNHVSNGMKKVDVDLQTQRLEICAACPFISADKSRCTKCGCFLAAKTKWESSSCPINKW